MKFWDSSAIIPLCIAEPQSKTVENIAKEDNALVVWWGSTVECHSAFYRLQHNGVLRSEENEELGKILASLAGVWTEIEPCEDIRDIAIRLLLSHPLRAADALQLAAAIVWTDRKPKGHHFVCLDLRLREAARKEGFSVLPSRN